MAQGSGDEIDFLSASRGGYPSNYQRMQRNRRHRRKSDQFASVAHSSGGHHRECDCSGAHILASSKTEIEFA